MTHHDKLQNHTEYTDHEREVSMMFRTEEITVLIRALRFDIEENDGTWPSPKKKVLLDTLCHALNYKQHKS